MKIAIIGAGVSGLYLGLKLAKNNDVTIFEKNAVVGNKICSGLFSSRILDFIPESKSLIENEINHVLIHFPKKTVKVIFSKKFYVMDHSDLDRLLADLCHNAGVSIVLNSKISEIPTGFDRIIGTDGADSFIRKYLKADPPDLRIGIQAQFDGESNKDFVEAWPCEDGFFWVIPRGKNMECGTISNSREAYRIFSGFIKDFNIKAQNTKAKMIPQGLPELNDEKVALCGDAAGLTKPWSGGGVIWGLIAANILLKTFPDFKKYNKEAQRFFAPRIKRSKIFTKLVYFFGFKLPWFMPKRVKIESDFLF